MQRNVATKSNLTALDGLRLAGIYRLRIPGENQSYGVAYVKKPLRSAAEREQSKLDAAARNQRRRESGYHKLSVAERKFVRSLTGYTPAGYSGSGCTLVLCPECMKHFDVRHILGTERCKHALIRQYHGTWKPYLPTSAAGKLAAISCNVAMLVVAAGFACTVSVLTCGLAWQALRWVAGR